MREGERKCTAPLRLLVLYIDVLYCFVERYLCHSRFGCIFKRNAITHSGQSVNSSPLPFHRNGKTFASSGALHKTTGFQVMYDIRAFWPIWYLIWMCPIWNNNQYFKCWCSNWVQRFLADAMSNISVSYRHKLIFQMPRFKFCSSWKMSPVSLQSLLHQDTSRSCWAASVSSRLMLTLCTVHSHLVGFLFFFFLAIN